MTTFTRILWGLILFIGLSIYCTARPVVIQEFTATWCPHCYGAGGALDRIAQTYSRDEVIIIAYHSNDDYETQFTHSAKNYYGIQYLPSVIFNGFNPIIGGANVYSGESGITNMYTQYVEAIVSEQERIKDQTPFEVILTGSTEPGNVNMHVTITSQTGFPRMVYAYFMLTEDKIAVDASNGQTELNSVMRICFERLEVTLTEPGSVELDANYSEPFDYVDSRHLLPLVFLLDAESGEIVGAVGNFAPQAAVRDWALYE